MDCENQPSGSLIDTLRRTPAFKRQAVLLESIREIVQDIRSVELGRPFQADQRILALGLPSLQLIELKQRIEQLFAVELPVTLFFEHVTLEGLTTYLLSNVLGLDTGPRPSAPEPEPGNDTARRTAELAQLSDEEAESRLLRHIAGLARTPEP